MCLPCQWRKRAHTIDHRLLLYVVLIYYITAVSFYCVRILTFGEQIEFVRNQSKWKAAMKYCEDQNMQFKIFTEKELGIY